MIITNENYEIAVKSGLFRSATVVRLINLPGVTALPDMPSATRVSLINLPGVTALPEMPAATVVQLVNLPGVTALPEMPKATGVSLYNLPGVTALPQMPSATWVSLSSLPGVTALPQMPSATEVSLYNLPGVTALPEMPKATEVSLNNLPGVMALPEMPAATDVRLDGLCMPRAPAPKDEKIQAAMPVSRKIGLSEISGTGWLYINVWRYNNLGLGFDEFTGTNGKWSAFEYVKLHFEGEAGCNGGDTDEKAYVGTLTLCADGTFAFEYWGPLS
jgi:hypothetical protein